MSISDDAINAIVTIDPLSRDFSLKSNGSA